MIPITQIHPMLVHFPIAFLLTAESIAVILLLHGQDMSARQHGPLTAFYLLLTGTAFAGLAAVFGDIALDHAVAAGFAQGPIERHEFFAIATLCLFILHTVLRLLTILRRYPLKGLRGWIAELPGIIGVFTLIYTGYLGGHLVYELGVNVLTVMPH